LPFVALSLLLGPFAIPNSLTPAVLNAAVLLIWLTGLCLGVTAWVLARRELVRMRAGAVDPYGKEDARFAWLAGIITTILSLAALLYSIAVGLFMAASGL
jgi:hypothetical protein